MVVAIANCLLKFTLLISAYRNIFKKLRQSIFMVFTIQKDVIGNQYCGTTV